MNGVHPPFRPVAFFHCVSMCRPVADIRIAERATRCVFDAPAAPQTRWVVMAVVTKDTEAPVVRCSVRDLGVHPPERPGAAERHQDG